MAIPNLPEGTGATGPGGIIVSIWRISGEVKWQRDLVKAAKRCVLVEPVANHLARPEPTNLDPLAPPSFLSAKEGEGGPADLSLSGQADASCSRSSRLSALVAFQGHGTRQSTLPQQQIPFVVTSPLRSELAFSSQLESREREKPSKWTTGRDCPSPGPGGSILVTWIFMMMSRVASPSSRAGRGRWSGRLSCGGKL